MTKRKTPQPDYAALASGQSQKSVSRVSSGNPPLPLEDPLVVPAAETGTTKRPKLDQLKATDLLTLVRNLDPKFRFYNHKLGVGKAFKDSFAQLLNMRKPAHLMLAQIGEETTKTWILKLKSGSLVLVEWLENQRGVNYDRETWTYTGMKLAQQSDLRFALTRFFLFVVSDTLQHVRNQVDKWEGWEHFVHSLHLLAMSDKDHASQPVLTAADSKLAARNEQAEKVRLGLERDRKKIAVTSLLDANQFPESYGSFGSTSSSSATSADMEYGHVGGLSIPDHHQQVKQFQLYEQRHQQYQQQQQHQDQHQQYQQQQQQGHPQQQQQQHLFVPQRYGGSGYFGEQSLPLMLAPVPTSNAKAMTEPVPVPVSEPGSEAEAETETEAETAETLEKYAALLLTDLDPQVRGQINDCLQTFEKYDGAKCILAKAKDTLISETSHLQEQVTKAEAALEYVEDVLRV